jgi:tetratricopeptide (TPR) repeat protein
MVIVGPSRAAAQETPWVGESVIAKKPPKDIQFSDWIDDKHVVFVFSGRMPLTVRREREGWVRIHDGHREGWVKKADFILARDAPVYFHSFVQANPMDAWALHMRGSGWLYKGEADIAIKDFDECIRLDPKDTAAFNSRGNAWKTKKEYEKAISDYDEAIRWDPSYLLAFYNRGSAWMAKREYEKAIEDYGQAIRLAPDYGDAFRARGKAWIVSQEGLRQGNCGLYRSYSP